MKLNLLENAIESLETTYETIGHLCNDEIDLSSRETMKYLKRAILSINNALELFIKLELSDINELLVFSPNDSYENYFEYVKSQSMMPFYEYVVKNNLNVTTLSYSKCIEIFFKATNVSYAYKNSVVELNKIRNKFIHLGIDSTDEFYEWLYHISCGMNMLVNESIFFKRIISFFEEEDNVDKAFDIEQSIFSLEEKYDELWFNKYQDKISRIISLFRSVIEANGYELLLSDLSMKDDRIGFISCIVEMKDTNHIKLDFSNRPDVCALILSGEFNYGPLFAVFPLGGECNNKVYITNGNGLDVQDLEGKSEFWKKEGEYPNIAKLLFPIDISEKAIQIILDKYMNYSE